MIYVIYETKEFVFYFCVEKKLVLIKLNEIPLKTIYIICQYLELQKFVLRSGCDFTWLYNAPPPPLFKYFLMNGQFSVLYFCLSKTNCLTYMLQLKRILMHFLFLLQMTRRAILCSTIYLAFYCVFHRRVTCFSYKFEHHKFIIYNKLSK